MRGPRCYYDADTSPGECMRRDEIDRLHRQIGVLSATLQGVQGMAEIEIAAGSQTWKRALRLIEAALADRREA